MNFRPFFTFFRFLGGQFTTYGTGVISQTEGNFTTRGDHLNVVFPKVRQYSTFKGRAFREDYLISYSMKLTEVGTLKLWNKKTTFSKRYKSRPWNTTIGQSPRFKSFGSSRNSLNLTLRPNLRPNSNNSLCHRIDSCKIFGSTSGVRPNENKTDLGWFY